MLTFTGDMPALRLIIEACEVSICTLIRDWILSISLNAKYIAFFIESISLCIAVISTCVPRRYLVVVTSYFGCCANEKVEIHTEYKISIKMNFETLKWRVNLFTEYQQFVGNADNTFSWISNASWVNTGLVDAWRTYNPCLFIFYVQNQIAFTANQIQI